MARTLVVVHPDGLHLRRCLAVVNALRRFRAHVTILANGRVEDASSMLGLMSLAVSQGTQINLSATGPEAKEAIASAAAAFSDELGADQN